MSKLYCVVEYSGFGKIKELAVDENGNRSIIEVPFYPEVYERFSNKEKSEFKDLYGNSVVPTKLNGDDNYITSKGYEAKLMNIYSYRNKYKHVEGKDYCGDINTENQYIHKYYGDEIKNIPPIATCFMDLEMSNIDNFPNENVAKQPIISATMYCTKENIYYVFGYKDYTPKQDNVKYTKCENEKILISNIWNILSKNIIISGWNIEHFDIKYLVNRSINLQIDFVKYIPFKKYEKRRVKRWVDKGNYIDSDTYNLKGLVCYDYMELMKKYNFEPQENYKLNTVTKKYLNKEKVEYLDEFKNLTDLYNNDFEKFIDYNIKDVELIILLEEKLGYISLAKRIAYLTHVNLNDIWGTTKLWDSFIYNKLMEDNIIIPKLDIKEGIVKTFEGAFVKESIKGMYDWVVSYDVASMYPNLMISGHFTPCSIVNKKVTDMIPEEENLVSELLNDEINFNNFDLKENKLCMSACGVFFDIWNDDPIANIVEDVFNKRVEFKAKAKEAKKSGDKDKEVYYKQLIQAYKILINSLYGAFGNQYFRFYDIRIARSITLTGQYVVRKVADEVDKRINDILKSDKSKIVASDTDSIYINLKDLVEFIKNKNNLKNLSIEKELEIINGACRNLIKPTIEKVIENISNQLNFYKNSIKMEKEKICDKSIFIGKKRYILNVVEDEGIFLDKPKKIFKGVDIVRSTTPEAIKIILKDAVDVLFKDSNKKNFFNYIKTCRENFDSMSIEDISMQRGVKNLDGNKTDLKGWITYKPTFGKDNEIIWPKGIPIHVRATWLYNILLDRYNLKNKYQVIQEGDKVKYVYLKIKTKKNHITNVEHIVGFPVTEELPKEFDLHKFIDYDTQYEKVFIKPIQNIVKALGWEIGKDDFVELF